jgi:hypothetical protein
VINCPIVAARPLIWLAATRPAVESLRYRAFGAERVLSQISIGNRRLQYDTSEGAADNVS